MIRRITAASPGGVGVARSGTLPLLAFACLLQLAIAAPAAGQTAQGVPDSFGYSWEPTAYDFVPLSTGLGSAVDTMSTPSTPLPWSFDYYGNTYTSLKIGIDGAAVFGGGGCTFVREVPTSCLPDVNNGPYNCDPDFAVFWAPLDAGNYGAAWTYFDAPRDRFIVSWEDVDLAGSTYDGASFQLHLYSWGRIELQFADVVYAGASWDFGAAAVIGIQDFSGGTAASGAWTGYSCMQPVVAAGTAVAFKTATMGDQLDVCGTGCPFATLAGALAAAQAGDVVTVAPGIWTGCVAVPDGVVVRGTGATPDEVVLDGLCSASAQDPALDLGLGSQLRNLRVTGGDTGIRATLPAAIQEIEVREVGTGILAASGSNLAAARIDIRAADIGVDVASGGALDAVNLLVIGDAFDSIGVRSAGAMTLAGTTLATASGSAALGYGLKITAGSTEASDLAVTGWGFGISVASGPTPGPALLYGNTVDLVGAASLGAVSPSQLGVDPLFAAWPCASDIEACDLHPQSSQGRWDAASQTLTLVDAGMSPLIDAGSQISPRWSAESDTQCRRVDLGAYGGTIEASLGALAPSSTAGPDPSACKAFNATSGQWFGGLFTAASEADVGDVIQLAQTTHDATVSTVLPDGVTVEPLPLATRPLLQGNTGFFSGSMVSVGSNNTLSSLRMEGNPSGRAIDGQAQVLDGLTLQDLQIGLSQPPGKAVYFKVPGGSRDLLGDWLIDSVEVYATDRAVWFNDPAGVATLTVNNSALEGGSGALYLDEPSGDAMLTDSSFLCSAGTAVYGYRLGGAITIEDSLVSAKSGQPYTGSDYAMFASFTGPVDLSVIRSVLAGKVVSSGVGQGAATISSSILAHCQGSFSSPRFSVDVGDGTLLISNSILRFADQSNGDAGIVVTGGASTAVLSNTTVLGASADLSGLTTAVVTNSYFRPADGPALLLPVGNPTSVVSYNGYDDDSGAPVFADQPTDSSNFPCDAGIALVCDYSDPAAWLAPPGSCLTDAGSPQVLDLDGSPSDVGASGGPGAAYLLAQFDLDADGVAGTFDCDDADPTVYPGAPEVCGDGIDSDCSGGDAPDDDLDGFEDDSDAACPAITAPDCDDFDASIFPGALEISCDGTDQDCDTFDELDLDQDGADCPADCDDSDPDTWPGAPELCDLVDNDCDGLLPADEQDLDADSMTPCEGDCDDADPTTFDLAPELCDGLDNDCDNVVPADEGDGDGDGSLTCADCDDADPLNYPGNAEVCDGFDNDCDGVAETGGEDDDNDGFSLCDTSPDCDDTDSSVYPGAPELCDGLDNDCDGSPDADIAGEVDADSDGSLSCADCDDSAPSSYPLAPELCDGLDNDCDGAPSFDAAQEADVDNDGSLSCADCDDADPTSYPFAPEVCDGADNDCNLLIDDGPDDDGDGVEVCDCDDTRATVYPGAFDLCDGLDTDCDGALEAWDADDDADLFVPCIPLQGEPDPTLLGGGDCDDLDPDRFPGAPELCDGLRNDCDTATTPADELDADLDSFVVCFPWVGVDAGILAGGDCDDADPAAYPGAIEVCDGVDRDCNGTIDDALDVDGDGLGPCDGDCDETRATVRAGVIDHCDGLDTDCDGVLDPSEADGDGDGHIPCAPLLGEPGPAVLGGGDCDDAADDTYPGAPELCDGERNDCEQTGLPAGEQDQDGDGDLACAGDCNDTNAAVHPDADEICDRLDNDCDGVLPDEEQDADEDGFAPCESDCDDADPQLHPEAVELCDGVDQDCDGDIVEGFGDANADGLPDCDGVNPVRAAAPGCALSCSAGATASGSPSSVLFAGLLPLLLLSRRRRSARCSQKAGNCRSCRSETTTITSTSTL